MAPAWLQRLSWRGLRRLTGSQEWLRRRLTPTGRVVLSGTLLAGMFGVDTRQTLAFQTFSLGLALLLSAWVLSLRRPRVLRAERRLPRHATVGVAVRYGVEVKNLGVRPERGLRVVERLPDPRPELDRFLNLRAPGEQRINPFDRLFAYPRWRWLVQQGRRAEAPREVPLPDLAAGEGTRLELELVPRRRGFLRLEALEASRSDPLGLVRRGTSLASSERLLVLPRRYPVSPQRPPGHRRLQPGGVNLASSVGDSQEYMGLRDYRPGDSQRHIHWAAWARYGEPVVKEYQDEYFSRQALVLDTFPATDRGPDFEIAVSVAASFVEPLEGGDALLDLMFVADRAYTLTGGRGLMSGEALLEVLACVEPAPSADFAGLARAVLAHAPALSACLCVLLDWDRGRRELAGKLRALGLPVRVLVVGGPAQLEPGPLADLPGSLCRLDPADPAPGLATL
jgi:uncharacterized protein (DUF58 family)